MKLPDMSKKVGPFPLYVWLIAGAAGIGLYLYINRSTEGSEEEMTEEESNALIPGVGVIGGVGSGTDNSDTGTEDTNQAWAERAVKYLVGKGTSPLAAEAVVNKYLSSQPLTTSDTVLINLLLLQVGRPPDPPTDIPTSSDTLNIVKWSSPATRKTSNPNWADGRGVASRNYTWIEYLRTHYDHLPPAGDFREQVLAGWLAAYNGRIGSVKKGVNVKIPKNLWLKKWPTN